MISAHPPVRPSRARRLASAVALLVGTTAAACGDGTAPRGGGLAPSPPVTDASASLGRGVVVWESNFDPGGGRGSFRIFRQRFGGGAEPLTPVEAGRDHCCAALSPAGEQVVYLSLPAGRERYSTEAGTLHAIAIDGTGDRVLAESARHYGEHRAALFWDADHLLYLDGENRTRLLTLSTGASRLLAEAPVGSEGWLIAPGGQIATGNTPTFSDLRGDGRVALRPSLGGCQPFFSADGRRAVWSAGAGGPIDAIDLASRRTWTILGKNDPRLPPRRGYLYFPALASDARLLVFAASDGEHDHFRADYDLFAVELDPATLLPLGQAVAFAATPGVDRYPVIHRDPASAPSSREPPAAVVPSRPTAGGDDAIAADRLAYLWRRSDHANRLDPEGGSEVLRGEGSVWYDRTRAMALAGGSFRATDDGSRRLSERLAATHQFTLSLLLRPVSLDQSAPILALSDGARGRNLVLRQERRELQLVLRTSDSPREGAVVPLGALEPGEQSWALAFSPGRLRVFRAGRPAGETRAVPGDFYAWRPRALSFGAEPGDPSRWRGALAEVMIWNRPLGDEEIAAEQARIEGLQRATREVARLRVEAELVATTSPPSLDRISPYREALTVDLWRTTRQLDGSPLDQGLLRVARWAILDGRTLPAPSVGEIRRLTLERFGDQPQLEPFYLAEDLPPESEDAPLWFDLGPAAEP